ncbi:MAG: glycoside hydrolase family 3 C-terminal domain-containing protein [Brevefilum sp.]|nr:glycoside hydrolase family 3 C-terminal domain-containing protein [Brevefilum sp.]MDT8381644.1 glycoside hydrolase family 3 C-terminal domain-containing protein [Brevefilum sp.]MDW7754908.1 glycoside hydrolase family 3 C-terminal domain-containing protein [Brevefilum sp.]
MEKINTLISRMTLEEKAALCTGASAWTTVGIDRLNIPSIFMVDGPHGVRRVKDEFDMSEKSRPATCFPTAACASATWNTDLIRQMGEAMAEEAHAFDVDILLGPGVNIKRTPLGGRNFEYYSEDPFLSGKMAVSLIKGIQSKGVGTSLKHFAANNQEYQRFSIDTIVDQRTLREIYLYAFEIAVKEAKPWAVMCAYNKINGDYCSEHHQLLVDILKDEWGFEGFVVSDWGAVHDRVKSLKGGLDLEMPGPQDRRVKAVVEAVKSGDLDIEILDEAVRRILRIVFKAQEVERNSSFDKEAHHALAREIASEGIVLLKNDGILPLKGETQIAVIGHSAVEPRYQGGGSSNINPIQLDIPLDEIKKHAGEERVTYAQGDTGKDIFDQSLIDEAVEVAKSADVALLFLALPASIESEGYDRENLHLTQQQILLVQAVSKVQPESVVILNTGSAVTMSGWIDEVKVVLQAWLMGQAGAGAIADILFGKINPSGKLAETFPIKLEDTPAYINFPGDAGEVRYGEGLYVGYRYYDAKKMPVQFPFGFGLSYTTFKYSNLQVADAFTDIEGLTISVDITNTGKAPGKEIVQVYVHDHEASLSRPIKALKGFAKVKLAPGETKTVSIPLDFRSFAFYHPDYKNWITEDGDFDILIGASSQDIRLQATTKMTSSLKPPCVLDSESTLREWIADPRGYAAIKPMMLEMQAMFNQEFDSDEGIGMDPMGMIMDMRLDSILMFQQHALPIPVDDIVDGFLREAHSM